MNSIKVFNSYDSLDTDQFQQKVGTNLGSSSFQRVSVRFSV